MLIFMTAVILAAGMWAGRPKKPYRRKIVPVRILPQEKGKPCSTCGGNCGQCGSSH